MEQYEKDTAPSELQIILPEKHHKNIVFFLIRATLLVCLGVFSLIQIWSAWQSLYPNGMDLQQDYIAAQRVRHGLDIYEPFSSEDLAALNGKEPKVFLTRNGHPPLVSVLFIPLSYLPFKWAALIWTIGCVITLWVSVNIILAELQIRIDRFWRYLFQMSILNWYPVLMHLNFGQIEIPLFFIVVTSWTCLRRGRKIFAGVFLTFATLIKLYPIVLLFYAMLRYRWHVLKTAVLVAFALVMIQTAINPRHWPDYLFKVVPTISSQWQNSWYNHSLSSISIRFFEGTDISYPIVNYPKAELPLRLLLYAITFGCLAIVFWHRRSIFDLSGDFSLLIVSMLLLSPVIWNHAFVFLILPICYLWQQVKLNPGRWRRWPVALTSFAIALSIPHWRELMHHVQTLYAMEKLSFLISLFSPGVATLICFFVSILLTLRARPS